ncbi:MAG: class I SAM-dependent methyltransferase [Candidatus Paceibacterales bacterium]
MNLEKQKRTQKYFEWLYRVGLKPWVWQGREPALDDFFQLLLEKHSKAKVLDIGCGNGWISVKVAKKGIEVWGIDSSETAIREAKEIAEKVGVDKITHFQVGDALDLPYQNKFFDALIDRGLLHHILPENRLLYFQNILRVLKPKSLMYLTVFSTKNLRFIGQLFSPKIVKELFNPHFDIIYFSQDLYPPIALTHLLHFTMERKGS